MAAPIAGSADVGSDFLAKFLPILRDENYSILEKNLKASGRGRRPLPVDLKCNNRLLLQLHVLHSLNECTIKWDTIIDLFLRLFPVKRNRVRPKIEQAVKLSKRIETDAAFLAFLEKDVEFSLIVKHSCQLTEELLCGPIEDLSVVAREISLTNGIIVDIEKLCKKRGINIKKERLILEAFGYTFDFSDNVLKKRIASIVKRHQALDKSNYRKNSDGKGIADLFVVQTVNKDLKLDIQDVACQSRTVSVGENVTESSGDASLVPLPDDEISDSEIGVAPTPVNFSSPNVASIQLGCKLRGLEAKISEVSSLNETLTLQLDAIKEAHCSSNLSHKEEERKCKVLKQDLADLKQDLAETKIEVVELASQNREYQSEIADLKSELRSKEQSAYYKRLQRKEVDLNEKRKIVDQHEANGCDAIIDELKKKVKNLQTLVANEKCAKEKCKKEKEKLCEKMRTMEMDFSRAIAEEGTPLDRPDAVQTKQGHAYSSEVIKTVIELIGEAEVAAGRCSDIIRIVARNMFNTTLEDLPSERTSLRFADRGHVLAKMHIGSAIEECQYLDVHSDGTSKDHNHYMGQQLTLDTGDTLTTGFCTVAKEDADTIVEVTMSVFQEIADVYAEDADQHYRTTLSKMVGMMSDRASVMKSFNKKFDQHRKDLLETEETLEFIHCNAHFLLGLSSETEKVLKELTKGEKFGRDNNPSFGHFGTSAENCAARYVRLACDSLGPRGDDKSGCRDAWYAYCDIITKPNQITSFKSNRFNNYFQAATALHYHRSAIIQYFTVYHTNNNQKLRSVLLDAEDDDIDVFITALGIMYFKVTGPYWLLVRSKVLYLDFFKYVVKLDTALETWSKDATTLLQPDTVLFDDFQVKNDEVMQALYDQPPTPSKDTRSLKLVLEALAAGFLTVTKRQLPDFLPGGRYHDVDDEQIRKRMNHCQLTNLLGEACFGDLDFSLFKRRNASLHHHSTVNMMKRNHTMSKWFAHQPAETQERLLMQSATLGPSLRDKHKSATKQVHQDVQNALRENKRKAHQKVLDLQKRKEELTMSVRDHGGPCLSSEDLKALLRRNDLSQGSKTKAIKDEIRYQKIVLGHKSKHLKVTGSFKTVSKNIKKFFQKKDDPEATSDSEDSTAEANEAEDVLPERAVATAESSDDDDSGSESDNFNTEDDIEDEESNSESENESEMPSKATKLAFNFKFSQQGTWVAVYYCPNKQPEFYLGQVTDIRSDSIAKVKFMQQCGVKETVFKFPPADDNDWVESKFVFSSDFTVTTANGRTWNIADIKDIKKRFKSYMREFC